MIRNLAGYYTYLLFLLIVPSDFLYALQIKIPESMTQEFTLIPNEKFKKSIPLINTSDKIAKVKVYQSDYLYYANGENHYLDPGTTLRSNANWIRIYPSYLEIPPHSQAHVTYEGQVPTQDDLAGTFWSLIFIEPQEKPIDLSDSKNMLAINTIVRYGYQIVTHLRKKGKGDLKIVGKTVTKTEGQYFFNLDVENIGQSLLAPSVVVNIFDMKGKIINQFKQSKRRIYPFCSVRYEIQLFHIETGTYQALVVLDAEENHLFGAQYMLDLQ